MDGFGACTQGWWKVGETKLYQPYQCHELINLMSSNSSKRFRSHETFLDKTHFHFKQKYISKVCIFSFTLAAHPNGRIERARPLFSQHPQFNRPGPTGQPATFSCCLLLAVRLFGCAPLTAAATSLLRLPPPRSSIYLWRPPPPLVWLSPYTPPSGEIRKTMRQSGKGNWYELQTDW